jgi:hypothetical protein
MIDDLSIQFADAGRRGAEMLATEHRARAARFDAVSGRIVVDLANGCSFAFPARLAQGLEDASADALAEVEVLVLQLVPLDPDDPNGFLLSLDP